MAVSKTVPEPLIIEAIEAGIRIIGENYVQEAEQKIKKLKNNVPDTVSWHMIGHLQKNKVRKAVQLFDVIETVDSIELAKKIDKVAEEMGKYQRVLVQVKLSDEPTKFGVPEFELERLLDAISNLGHIRVEGLMLMPPYFDDPEKTRPYFRRLRQLKEELHKKGFSFLKELSMGMSHDFEVAVQEGATIVRIGTAIFGPRRKG